MTTDGNTSKPRRRQPGKPTGQPDDKKVKVTLYLPADLAKRFAVHAVQTEQDKSELFAEMVKAHCKRFVVHDRDRSPGDTGEHDAA